MQSSKWHNTPKKSRHLDNPPHEQNSKRREPNQTIHTHRCKGIRRDLGFHVCVCVCAWTRMFFLCLHTLCIFYICVESSRFSVCFLLFSLLFLLCCFFLFFSRQDLTPKVVHCNRTNAKNTHVPEKHTEPHANAMRPCQLGSWPLLLLVVCSCLTKMTDTDRLTVLSRTHQRKLQ